MFGQEQLQRLIASLAGLGTQRLAVLGLAGLLVFASVGLGSYYLSRPELETLYGGLSTQDVTRMGSALREAGIVFDVSSDGTKVLVARGHTAQARMLLAEKGLPGSSSTGYELFDKLGTMGLTSFMQEITRVRALEGEIARTIQTMKGIKAARVHIVMPEAGSMRRNNQSPTASVVIRSETAGDFSASEAIRHLVAAAVPGLSIDQVKVMSTDGTVLAGGDGTNATPTRMLTLEKTISRELQDNVRVTLAPYFGLGNFQISVAARLNLDKRQTNETAYDPESRVERSVRTIRETGSTQNMSNRGAVGVEQNLPAEQPSQAGGDQSRKANDRREEIRNFEVNTRTQQTVSEGYRIDNVTVAVVVNRKRLVASIGENPTQDAIDARLKEVERIVGTAAGIDAKRGDRVSVAAVDFVSGAEALEPAAPVGIVEQLLGHTSAAIKGLTILVATFLLVWFGLRPIAKTMMAQQAKAEADAAAAAEQARIVAEEQAKAAAIAQEQEAEKLPELPKPNAMTPQRKLERLIELGEEQAAGILRQWVRAT
ncbi:MAG: flagellar basal-body MS-ring/collar protein FliF [Hyphomicrobiaceae bacterium]